MRINVYSALGAQWISASLAIAASVLVARMMLPSELGIFTITMAVTSILGVLQNSGANEYLIYSATVTREMKQRVLGLILILTFVVCAALALSRPFWIAVFDSPAMADVAVVIAIQFAFGAFSAPVSAMMVRNEEFQKISLVNVLSGIILSSLQVFLVHAGYSYMGLAYAALASGAFSSIALILASKRDAVFMPRFDGLLPIIKYGSKLFGINSLALVYTQSSSILIGAWGSVAQSALFGRANMISQIYSQTIGRAVDPIARARLASDRRSGDDGNSTLFMFSRFLLTISAMFFGFIAIFADLIVPLIFGPQWEPAAPAMRILTAGLVLMPLTSPTAAVLLAAGQPSILFRVRAVNVLFRIGALIALAPMGLVPVAWGIVATAYVNWIQSMLAARKVANLPLRSYLVALWPSLAVAMVPLTCVLIARIALSALNISGWNLLMAGSLVMGVTSVLSLAMFKHPLWQELKHLIRFGKGKM